MTDDLLSLTLQMCGRKEDKTPRFPKYFYDTYVKAIIDTALTIQKEVYMANGIQRGSQERERLQKEACEYCTYLQHLIRVAHKGKWISDRQRDTWIDLVNNVKWKVCNWMNSDKKHIND